MEFILAGLLGFACVAAVAVSMIEEDE